MTVNTKPGDECMSDRDAQSIAAVVTDTLMQAVERRFGKYSDEDYDGLADELEASVADALGWMHLPQSWIDRAPATASAEKEPSA